MKPTERQRLRALFGEDAERYERARPTYPSAVFDDLAAFGHLAPGSRVLEIGCGTGQATLPLAEHGYCVVAVELSPEMAGVARRKLAHFPRVQVVVAAFEEWLLPEEPFDAVVSATAFHWIDPEVRVQRSVAALRPAGTLATISTHHIAGGDEAFFAKAQSCYERWDPLTPPGLRLEQPDEIPTDAAELSDSGLFDAPTFRRDEWDQQYTAASYRDVLLTYSNHRALAPPSQSGLLDCITTLIQTSYGGRISKRYMTELRMARKTAPHDSPIG
ncbi:MAG: class I SAM-dependent methyltransferase [Chloroflexota bacterium]